VPVLIDGEFPPGRPRKLLAQANRNAFFYLLDRQTGEYLLGAPYAKQTWAKGVHGQDPLAVDIAAGHALFVFALRTIDSETLNGFRTSRATAPAGGARLRQRDRLTADCRPLPPFPV